MMRHSQRLFPMIGTAAGLFVAGSGAALADVTPGDVWTNLQAIAAATGGTATGETSEAGGALTVSDIAVDYTLPFGAGSLSARLGTLVLTANGDGTVDVGGPDAQTLHLAFDIPDAGTGELEMHVALGDYSYTASGAPGDVLYTYSIESYDITFGDVTLTGEIATEVGEVDLTGSMTMTGLTGEYRVTEGDLIALSSEGVIAGGSFDFGYEVALPEGDSLRSESTATLGAMTADMAVALPANGVSILALADALRDGLSIRYSYTADSQSSTQETYLDGELAMAQGTSVSALTGTLSLDATGLSGDGTASDYAISFNQPLLFPLPVEVTVAGVEMDLALPLLQSDEPQRAVLKLVADGLAVDPELWAMFDPGAQLPRDPANLVLDLTAQLRMLIDLPDFEALAALESSGEMPAEIHALDVSEISLSAVGAAAKVIGAFAFDNSDLDTFDGLPAPDGTAAITLTGVDALMDRLVAMGLASDQDVMGARMMLGGFSREGASADERIIDIEIDGAAGTITANGQRLK